MRFAEGSQPTKSRQTIVWVTIMPYRSWLRLAAIVIAVALLVAAFQAWRADRRDRAQLAAELASTKQLLEAADARQRDRDAQLQQSLAALAAEKRTIVTPAQILRDLPRELPLPAPIVLQPAPASPAQGNPSPNAAQTPGDAPKPGQPAAIIPAEDLKPLYDFTLDCKACQAKLAASQADLLDEGNKTTALTKERDDALRIARGGSVWRRITRAAKWFLIGAASGAIAAKVAR